jgi:hypothetical protein
VTVAAEEPTVVRTLDDHRVSARRASQRSVQVGRYTGPPTARAWCCSKAARRSRRGWAAGSSTDPGARSTRRPGRWSSAWRSPRPRHTPPLPRREATSRPDRRSTGRGAIGPGRRPAGLAAEGSAWSRRQGGRSSRRRRRSRIEVSRPGRRSRCTQTAAGFPTAADIPSDGARASDVARFGVIDRSHLGSIDVDVVGPKRARGKPGDSLSNPTSAISRWRVSLSKAGHRRRPRVPCT